MKIETNHAKYVLLPQLGILVNTELEEEFAHLIPGELDEKKVLAALQSELSDEEIEKHLSSIRNITLNITEQCNFRCSYCTYSGNYERVRTHNKKSMSFTTARKAIDYLIALISNKKRKLKVNSINIGAYGGEPLMEFQLVQDIMEYAKKRFREKTLNKFQLEFQLNTNGYSLKDQIVDFLVKWDVDLLISLDGPKREHNKFRLTANGKETWETIMNNLEQIKKKYPGYYENKIHFLATLHPFHDYKKIDSFYFNHKDYFSLDNVSAYYVNTLFLKEEIKRIYEEAPFQTSMLNLRQIKERLDSKLTFKTIGCNTKFTQMCFPGEAKLFIDADGSFHICERIKSNLPIGDVDNGFDYDRIRSIYRQWMDEIIRNRCWECPAWSFCGVCAAQSKDENGVRIDCTYKESSKKMLKEYILYKEEGAKIKEQETPDNFSSVIDYFRQLESTAKIKDRLKPYVYKVEGVVNFVFYDVLNGNFYQFTPEGTVEELRKYLLEEGLIFETEGIVPNKLIVQNLREIQSDIHIRVLQIRLNGRGEDNCWNRLKNKAKKQYMPVALIDRIISECEYIPVHKIQIEAEDNDKEKIEKIVKEFKFRELELNIEKPPKKKVLENYKKLCADRSITFSGNVTKKRRIQKEVVFAFVPFFLFVG